MFLPSDLHVFTARSNPLHYAAPHRNWERFAAHMLASGVTLTVVECAYGDEDHVCALDGVRHIPVRARTRLWHKENLINIGIRRTPEAKYIAWIDADVIFHRPDWAVATLQGLQHYDILQPWDTCRDLDAKGKTMQTHRSFCHQFFKGQPVLPKEGVTWRYNGEGDPAYPHSGYAWATRREVYAALGGLFDTAAVGSGDHHMAAALAGGGQYSVHGGMVQGFKDNVKRWERRANRVVNGNIGYVDGVIDHLFHGPKSSRGYETRWQMFVDAGYDPVEHLVTNADGVYEFGANAAELRRAFDGYLRSRDEDNPGP